LHSGSLTDRTHNVCKKQSKDISFGDNISQISQNRSPGISRTNSKDKVLLDQLAPDDETQIQTRLIQYEDLLKIYKQELTMKETRISFLESLVWENQKYQNEIKFQKDQNSSPHSSKAPKLGGDVTIIDDLLKFPNTSMDNLQESAICCDVHEPSENYSTKFDIQKFQNLICGTDDDKENPLYVIPEIMESPRFNTIVKTTIDMPSTNFFNCTQTKMKTPDSDSRVKFGYHSRSQSAISLANPSPRLFTTILQEKKNENKNLTLSPGTPNHILKSANNNENIKQQEKKVGLIMKATEKSRITSQKFTLKLNQATNCETDKRCTTPNFKKMQISNKKTSYKTQISPIPQVRSNSSKRLNAWQIDSKTNKNAIESPRY